MATLMLQQHGVAALSQLVAAGWSEGSIRRRLEAGRLYRVQPKVYSLLPDVSLRGRMMAAVLTYGAAAMLSHRAAAAVWDLGPWPTGVIDVTHPGSCARRVGVRLHRAAPERVARDGFPVTTVARTLVDEAEVLPLGRLRDAFERAERLRLLDVDRVRDEMLGRRGAKKVRAILAELTEPEPTRSELERAFRALCTRARLPSPSFNASLHGFEVDALWPEQRLVVELDGWEFHGTRRRFEGDRRRDAVLAAAGYRVLRFTWRQVRHEPELVLRSLMETLDAVVSKRHGVASGGL